MNTVMPHSELVRKAMEYLAAEIADRKRKGLECSKANIYELIEETCLKFDLTPREASMLHDFMQDRKQD